MNWKQFLKPDWRKIVIFFIILFLELQLLGIIFRYPPEPPIQSFCCQDFKKTGIMPDYCKEINLTVEGCLKYENIRKTEAFYNLLILIFDIVIVYIISCFIVWVYDKVKKRK
jgi:hypothetical protein